MLTWKATQLKKIFKLTFQFFLGLMASVIVMEGVFVVISASPAWKVLPVVEAIMTGPDPETGYAYLPNKSGIWSRENRTRIYTNSHGLRSPEITTEKPEGVVRVAVLGDSFTEATQVETEKTFVALLEKKLNETGKNVQVINMGVSGAGPLLELLHLKEHGLDLSIDVAIFLPSGREFYSRGMKDDSQHPAYVENKKGELVIGRAYRGRFSQRYYDTYLGKVFFFLIQNSNIFRMVYARMKAKGGIMADQPVAYVAKAKKSFDACNTDRVQAILDLIDPSSEMTISKRRFNKYLADALELSTKHNIKFIFGMRNYDPDKEECPGHSKLREKLQNDMKEYFLKHSFGYIDLDWDIQKRSGSAKAAKELRGFGLNRGHGGHLNYDGHEMYASVLFDYLNDNQILESLNGNDR